MLIICVALLSVGVVFLFMHEPKKQKNETPREAQIKAFRRAVIACDTFRHVIAACELMSAPTVRANSEYYGIVLTGVNVAYNRPFENAHMLGKLGPKYSEFPTGSEHARTHKDLRAGRDPIFAHYSPTQAAEYLTDPLQRQEQKRLRFRVDGNGNISFRPPQISWPKENMPFIISLCNFQIGRLQKEIISLMVTLSAGEVYPPGEYILGETFP